MALVDNRTFEASSNLNLWLKVYTGDSLKLSDVPEIIALRWIYFRDNWQFIRQQLINDSSNAFDPDYLRTVIDDLTEFILHQKNDTTDVNPFSSSAVYFRFYPVFDNFLLESITLTNEEQSILTAKQLSVTSYSKVNFLDIKTVIRTYRDYVADTIGLADPNYDAIYERSPVRPQTPPSLTDMNLLKVLEKQLQVIDFILANLFAVDTALDPFAVARANADNPDIDIRQYSSGQLVKLNFGEDLPSLAKRYFGAADRWIDIAIANGLKEPYTDEIGEQLFLSTNGSGSQINITLNDPTGKENINKFYNNQLILIQSDAYPFPTQRTIIGIKQIALSGEIILTISGDANMSNYLLTDNASLRVYKPNTINSSQYILIPSPTPLSNPRVEEIPWFLSGRGTDEKNTKIDIAVGEDGQLLKTSTGDIALKYGLDNAVQAIKAKMQTELGANRRHPEYGLINLVGTSTRLEEPAKATLVNSIISQIQADSRFDRVDSITVERSSSTTAVAYEINIVVKLAGSKTFLPITFTVTT